MVVRFAALLRKRKLWQARSAREVIVKDSPSVPPAMECKHQESGIVFGTIYDSRAPHIMEENLKIIDYLG